MLKLNLCVLKNVPVWQQLAIEEALLRADDENWCVINEGSAPAIVFGISGKIDEPAFASVDWKGRENSARK